jgi:hypothetical protein
LMGGHWSFTEPHVGAAGPARAAASGAGRVKP